MIKDCFGNIPQVGDEIAFSMGNAGAKPWEHSVIIKITEKSVFFYGKAAGMFRDHCDPAELRRGEGSFVINLDKRTKGDS